MFVLNDDMSIYATRGDTVFFTVTATDGNGANYKFKPDDVVRFKAFEKKACENVVAQKDFVITEETEEVSILLTEDDTRFGKIISKPRDYWYEIELNPFTNPQTIIGYDDDGPKVFRLYPESKNIVKDISEEDIAIVDAELSLTSTNPVQNQALTRAMQNLSTHVGDEMQGVQSNVNKSLQKAIEQMTDAENRMSEAAEMIPQLMSDLNEEVTARQNAVAAEKSERKAEIAVERARINAFTSLPEGSTSGDAELIDARIDHEGITHNCVGNAVRYQTGNLDEKIARVNENFIYEPVGTFVEEVNLLNEAVWTDGKYVDTNGKLNTNADYSSTDTLLISKYHGIKMVCPSFVTYAFYDKSGAFIEYGTKNKGEWEIEKPSDAVGFRFACKISERETTTIYPIKEEYNVSLSPSVKTKESDEIHDVINEVNDVRKRIDTKEFSIAQLTSGEFKGIRVPDIKFCYDISFNAKIVSFDGLRLSYGRTAYNGSYIVIDDDNIYVHRVTATDEIVGTFPHGLVFSDFIRVLIKVNYFKAQIIVSTTNGFYKIDEVLWYGAKENIIISIPSEYNSELEDCHLTWCANSLKKEIWWYGDSYLDTYTNYLNEWGYDNALFDGWSGRGSADGLASLKLCLEYRTPKTIIWALGMNDGDNENSINSTWKAAVDEIIEICKDKDIELMFLTIPNTPTIKNSLKNNYIKSSGFKYLDVAESVGASETGSSWYNGLLGGDNVHPTILGRQAIASYIVSKMPQLRG